MGSPGLDEHQHPARRRGTEYAKPGRGGDVRTSIRMEAPET
jgi:hypothetical protein